MRAGQTKYAGRKPVTQRSAAAHAHRPALSLRPEAEVLSSLQTMAAQNTRVRALSAVQRLAEKPAGDQPLLRLEPEFGHVERAGPFQGRIAQRKPLQKLARSDGLPDPLKAGIERLSGLSMDHVRVHRNSDKPAGVRAHAFARGSDIHLAPGQERHLPHEAWHVVQQAQGRVRPTIQAKGIAVNDDATLEAEADRMGAFALTFGSASTGVMAPMGLHYPDPTAAPALLQRTEDEAVALANSRHPDKKEFDTIQQVLDAKIEFGREDWGAIVRAYNHDLSPGKPRLRRVYPEPEAETEDGVMPGLKGRIVGYDNEGRPFTQTKMEKVAEKLRLTIHHLLDHKYDFASTGVEMATHTVDAKALNTATREFMTALRQTGGDLSAGDYLSLAVHLVDAATGAVRAGASVAAATHQVSGAIAHAGTGIPGIGLLAKLSGDGVWYSAQYFRHKVHNAMDPRILRSRTYKEREGKLL